MDQDLGDKMNIVSTTAPIKIEDLKKYFEDKNTSYVIDYDSSTLKGAKLLTYLSNLDIPCNINFDPKNKDHLDLLKEYFVSQSLVKVESLEVAAIVCLLVQKGIVEDNLFKSFVEENTDLINIWSGILDSLTVYNMYSVGIEEFKSWAKSFPTADESIKIGVNFVNLLKYEDFYLFYNKVEETNLKFYEKQFNDYMFKTKNLHEFWANDKNPLFLLTYGLANGLVNPEEYVKARTETV